MIGKKWLEKLQENARGTVLPVRVSPASKEFAFCGLDEWRGSLIVRLRSKPEKGKANQELVERLQEFFSAKVELLSGEKSKEKKLLVHAKKERLIERLSEI
ncbi:MAG: DUF167 domain-containing protein [Candidatus Diapherotrites archaeon]|nr:DUF167 domain-containing protein [Candidatus Diapherotrites archaeon]